MKNNPSLQTLKYFSAGASGLLACVSLHGTVFDATVLSQDRIVGEAATITPDYYVDSAQNAIGVTGSTSGGTKRNQNLVFGFELPTLDNGGVIDEVTFTFFVEEGRNQGTLGNLDVYLLDTANPDTSGTTFFFENGTDISSDVAFVGEFTNPGGIGSGATAINQTVALTLSGASLALFNTFYTGENPTQTEAYFRFNLDSDGDIADINRYAIEHTAGVNFPTLTISTIPEPSTYALGVLVPAMALLLRRRFRK